MSSLNLVKDGKKVYARRFVAGAVEFSVIAPYGATSFVKWGDDALATAEWWGFSTIAIKSLMA